jgi:hypothetical protein
MRVSIPRKTARIVRAALALAALGTLIYTIGVPWWSGG